MTNHRIITSPFASIIAAILLVSTASSANAFTVFTGNDFRSRDDNRDISRLSSTPNADAASSNFLSNLIDPLTENFEGFTPGQVSSFSLNLGGAGTATYQRKGDIKNVPTDTIGGNFFPISGDQFLLVDNTPDPGSNNPRSTVNSITFSNPVAAIGLYATGVRNLLNQTLLELTLTDGSRKEFVIPNVLGPAASAAYLGVIAQDESEQFTKVTFTSNSSRLGNYGLDDLTVASLDQVKKSTPVPEPFTLLGSFMAAGVGLVLRRKYKQA
jgi:hypothetical protein